MKITLNKSVKRVISFVLAFAVLVGSLVVANVGVAFDTSATTKVEDTWDGSFIEPTATDDNGNIIIKTAEELAWVALRGIADTAGKNYKVVDNAVFNMNGMNGITLDSTAAEVKAATKNDAYKWLTSSDSANNAFQGNFDGNGVVVYNVYGKDGFGYSGLFPVAKQTANGNGIIIKNIKVCASYFSAYHGAGAIVGLINAPGTSCTATIENIAVENCYITDNGNTNAACQRTVSNIVGLVGHTKVAVSNCYAKGNTLIATNIVGGLVGNTSAYATAGTISNSIVIGSSPIPVEILTTDSHPLQAPMSNAKYSNVYSDQTVSKAGVTTLTIAQMTGTEATKNMALDFSTTWFANTSGAPVLRDFHSVSAIDNKDGTHNERCECGLVGLTANHIYNDVDYTTDTSSCICGVFVYGTNDVWDGTKATAFAGGTGTESDPYIIKTVEQLFLMVRSTGIDASGNPIYYEVADSVNALYINDTRAFGSQADFEAAVGSLKNWSTGLTTEAQCCGNTASCYSTHYNDVYTSSSTPVTSSHRDGYVDYFGGRFNGNGVTIYGLYSQTTAANHWNNGVGFVPMLAGDAVIKNVTFDTNYVKSNSANVGVITASMGIWDGQYNKDSDGNGSYETFAMCPKVDAYAKRADSANIQIMNVAVCNSYLEATNYVNKSYVSGFVSTIMVPNSLKFDNCLFDGTNSTIKETATTDVNCAFITSYGSNTNSTVTGCVSIEGSSTVAGLNSYTGANNAVVNSYELDSNEFTIDDAPLLNWLYWETNDGKVTLKNKDGWIADGYVNQGDYLLSWRKYSVLTSTDEYGKNYEYSAIRGNRGVFNDYNSLQGSGTEEDPYIINDVNTLYLIIASGGTHYGVPQHYKLACNIDLGGIQWIDTDVFENTTYDVVFYDYQPFAGTLDGDGHTISGLYTVKEETDEPVAGFIPRLAATGVVKNINFNNCYAYDDCDDGGVIAGYAANGSNIENCSLNNCINEKYVGYSPKEIWKDCYVVQQDGSVEYSGDAPELDGVNWYGITAKDATTPIRSTTFAKKMPCADIDADGVGEEYTANDLSVLKRHLLWADGYDYIYGDVSGNGKTDMRDLAALQRILSGKSASALDGFWVNVKEGKFEIYYDEDDNYDFARKMELYLERVTGVDVVKTKTSTRDTFVINVLTDTSMGARNYESEYDAENAVLTIKGGSFTAVEEAVDYVIANTSTKGVPADFTGTVGTAKAPVTVDGKTYYYAWGDEFDTPSYDTDGDDIGTVSYDKWILRNKGTDKTPGNADTEFEYIRSATDTEAREINKILYDEVTSNGKLYLKRGFTNETASNKYKFYMSGISSKDSMLFKQGYLEMVAAIPSDGYAFPAWWLLTHENGTSNMTIDKSLYSKVYERNGVYNGTSTVATPTDVTSYKYKLPTQTLEMDLFEIIQRPTKTWSWGSFSNVSAPSDDHNIKFNIHKWYSYSLYTDDNNLAVYDLNWAKAPTSGAFPTKLLTANGATNGNGYKQQSASILVNSGNLSDASINGAATYQGSVKTMQYDMENYRTNGQINERKYGFLWTEDAMTFIIYTDATGTKEAYRATVTKEQMNFGGSESYSNSDTFGFDQYAYMLIENHIFTAQKSSSGWIQAAYDDIEPCDLVIDYVRLYQLDDARAIITPESEALRDR